MKKIIGLSFFLLGMVNGVFAQFETMTPTLTEILLDDEDERSIFTCKVNSNWVKEHHIFYSNDAIVTQVFRGKVPEKIRLNLHFKPFLPEKVLRQNEEFLIIGISEDGFVWKAFNRDSYSALLSDPIYGKVGQSRLKAIKDFFELKEKKKSGKYELKEYPLHPGEGFPFVPSKEEILGLGQFKKGKPHGLWSFHEFEYPNRKRGGSSKWERLENNWYHELKYMGEKNYSNGVLEGVSKLIFELEDGPKSITSITFVNGEPQRAESNLNFGGKSVTFFVESEKIIGKDNIERTKSITTTSLNSSIEIKYSVEVKVGNIKNYKNIGSYLDGPYEAYYSEGKLKSKGRYYHGAKIGKWTEFSMKGEIIKEEFFDNVDTTITDFRIYNEEGHIIRGGPVKDGKQEGIWKYCVNRNNPPFFCDEVPFKNGEINGTLKRRRGDKLLTSSSDYLNGKRHGENLSYHNNGKVNYLSFYENGKAVSFYKKFDEKGILVDSSFNGELKPDGEHFSRLSGNEEITTYKNGLKNGLYTWRNIETGFIYMQGNYQNGIEVGIWIYNNNTDNFWHSNFHKKECDFGKYELEINISRQPKCIEYDEDGNVINNHNR